MATISNSQSLVWSNFEIGDLDFWRSEAYGKFFDTLDAAGGFYYERWGDAPVHSIAAALFARKDQIHFFNDVGYRHPPFTHCPSDFRTRQANNCSCKSWGNFGERIIFKIEGPVVCWLVGSAVEFPTSESYRSRC